MESLVVLWLFFSPPWSWHGLPMTPGWASVAVLDPDACQEALSRTRTPAVCAAPEVMFSHLARVRHTPP